MLKRRNDKVFDKSKQAPTSKRYKIIHKRIVIVEAKSEKEAKSKFIKGEGFEYYKPGSDEIISVSEFSLIE